MSPISGLAGFGGGVTSKLLGGGGGGGGAPSSFTFDYHMYGANIGDLEVYVYDTTAASLIGPHPLTYDDGNATGTVISGQQHTSGTDAWSNAVVDLSDSSGVTGHLAFKYRPKTGSFTGDAAIDSMALTLPDETVIDLEPDLARSANIQNWESARFTNQTDDSFPLPGGPTLINIGAFGYSWITTPKSASANYMGQYEDANTGSGNTGPNYDSDGNTTQYYIYWETSSNNRLYTAWLRTANQYTF